MPDLRINKLADVLVHWPWLVWGAWFLAAASSHGLMAFSVECENFQASEFKE